MYSSLLAKHQFKIIVGLWQKQQLQLLTAGVIKSKILTGTYKNYTTIISRSQNEKEFLFPSTFNKRLHQDRSQDKSKQSKQLEINETEDEENAYSISDEIDSCTQNFNLKRLLYTERDVIMDKLNSCESLEKVSLS